MPSNKPTSLRRASDAIKRLVNDVSYNRSQIERMAAQLSALEYRVEDLRVRIDDLAASRSTAAAGSPDTSHQQQPTADLVAQELDAIRAEHLRIRERDAQAAHYAQRLEDAEAAILELRRRQTGE